MMQNQADNIACGGVPIIQPSFQKVDLDKFNTVWPRWTKCKKRFVNFFVALKTTDMKNKFAMLLNYLREKAYDV